MKRIFLLLVLTTLQTITTAHEIPECKNEILKYYGLKGSPNTNSYDDIVGDLEIDFCPGTQHSCCTRDDFERTSELWEAKAAQMKKYFTKFMKIIEKATVMQSALNQIAMDSQENDSPYCKQINMSLLSQKINYEQIYFYVKNALETYSFMQKGFYCMLCDAKQHQFLGLDDGIEGKRIAISHDFCSKLSFSFKQFLNEKLYFIDPMIINANFIFNCYKRTTKYDFEFHYSSSFSRIKNCLENNEGCDFLCKEFVFGSTSDLLIGDLEQYENFYKGLEEVVEAYDPLMRQQMDNEANVSEETYPRQFFFDEDSVKDLPDRERIMQFNLSDWSVEVKSEGINLIELADNSNYYFTNAQTAKASKISMSVVLDENGDVIEGQKEKDWETNHEREKLEQDPKSPSRNELEKMQLQLHKMEDEFDKNAQNGIIDEVELGNEESNFGAVAEIKKGAMKIGVVVSCVMMAIMR